jgi:hypothetical protein
MGQDSVYVLRAGPAKLERPPGDAISINADHLGNVIFQKEEVPPDRMEDGLRRCSQLAERLFAVMQGTLGAYEVKTVTFKLALDAEVGLAFVGTTGIEAGIEVEVTRKTTST